MSDKPRGFLDVVERVGNRLPTPATLFVIAALIVMVLSHAAVVFDWRVKAVEPRPVLDAAGHAVVDAQSGRPKVVLVDQKVKVERPVRDAEGRLTLDERGKLKTQVETTDETRMIIGRTLLSRDGIYYAISHVVWNFVNFPPLGIVLSAMIGIGVAERSGLVAALLRACGPMIPKALLTPAVMFLGVMSSAASDSGYLILPPLAAALYIAAGRHPLAGISVATASVSGGFSANLLVTAIDPVIASFTTGAARAIDPAYEVQATANWWFMMASVAFIPLVGWAVTAWVIEPRLNRDGDAAAAAEMTPLSRRERSGMVWALGAGVLVLGTLAALALLPGGPLEGTGPTPMRTDGTIGTTARWSQGIVVAIIGTFLIPGIVYGWRAGSVGSEKDVAKLMNASLADMASVIVLAFFASQFIEWLKYSRLDQMLAMVGGSTLAALDAPWPVVLVLFILLTLLLNLLVSSMSAKYAMMAPIFVPMFMLLGLAPELTQGAYRVADSVTNMIAPLNAYLVIILAVMQRYRASAGMGTLLSLMTPYSVWFSIAWTAFLLLWVWLGIPLGPGGQLFYSVP